MWTVFLASMTVIVIMVIRGPKMFAKTVPVPTATTGSGSAAQ
jgi:hypothetical protein